MEFALWIAASLAAAASLLAGYGKAANTKKFMESTAWTEKFSIGAVRTIGLLEILGAIGLILPQLTGILPWLTIAAAAGLALIQVGAMTLHISRGEYKMLPINLVLFALPAFVFFGRLLWV
ncbi:DoxX family protein [Agromyces bauzanensis]|uniref:DoxX family protein n=1 Tax=Agromyces bauzanensis TaxID=1308924 RepID=A0A917PSQ4_9MICO|nr:DoxX family protein [Agromyces bauzanensis]GGJ89663.1 hypothetical protein GCM10011372_30280 [Agromyces bauzanensis]